MPPRSHSCLLMNPTTFDTANFGGMLMHMWTWSDIKWPSRIRASFCFASSWRIFPRCVLIAPYIFFLRYFGMNTT